MSTEINTRGMVRSKAPGFPAGNDAECLSKSEITATGRALVNGSYGDNECPTIEDIAEVRAQIGVNFATSGFPCRIVLFDRDSWWGGMVPENIVEYVEIEEYELQIVTLKNVFNGNYFVGISPTKYDMFYGDNYFIFSFIDEDGMQIPVTSFTVAEEYSQCISTMEGTDEDIIKNASVIWINNSSDWWGGIKVAIAEVVLENGKKIEIRVCADRQF